MADPINYMGQNIPAGGITPQPQAQTPPKPDLWAAILSLLGGGQQQQPAPQMDFGSLLSQMRNDPQGDANKGYVPGEGGAHSPFANGFFNNSAASLSPEARQATQGNSAMTQFAQMGQVPGVDPAKLAQVTGGMTPTPSSNPLPVAGVSDPYFEGRLASMFAPTTVLPPLGGPDAAGKPQKKPAPVRSPLGSPKPGFRMFF